MMAPRSYVLGEYAENVAAIAGDEGKWTWGERCEELITTEKLAANGRGLGDSGRGAGRLRIDLAEAGFMKACPGDFKPALRIDWDAIVGRKGS
jgi:hypothetical protein